MYVLIRTTDGAFVACPGSAGRYTRSLQGAQLFKTRDEAARNACPGNEYVVPLRDAFTQRN